MSLQSVEQASEFSLDEVLCKFGQLHQEQEKIREYGLLVFRQELWREVALTTFMGTFDTLIRPFCTSFVESEIDCSRIPMQTCVSDVITNDPYLFTSLTVGTVMKKTVSDVVMYRSNQTYFLVGKDFTTVIHHPGYDFSEVGIDPSELERELSKVERRSAEMAIGYGENFVQNMYSYLDIAYTGLDTREQLDDDAYTTAVNFLKEENVDTSDLRFIRTGISSHFFNQHVIISYCQRGHIDSATVWPSNFNA